MDENLNDNSELESEESLIPISGMYKDWFIDYASYVILERAVPAIIFIADSTVNAFKSTILSSAITLI